MTNAKNKTPKDSRRGYGGYRFINVALTSQAKKDLAAMDLPSEYPVDAIFYLVEQGYKLSVNADEKNHSFVASLTDKREDVPTAKCILTGRGSSPLNAFYALCYKHFTLLSEDWSSYIPLSDGDSSDFG
jgi:hypothetical protein